MCDILNFKLYCESKSEFYHPISYLPNDGYDGWTDKEISNICEWLNRNIKGYRTTTPSKIVSVINIWGHDYSLNIYKQKDEWWILTGRFDWMENKQYKWKCDQWDGLTELLSDLLINKSVNENVIEKKDDYYVELDGYSVYRRELSNHTIFDNNDKLYLKQKADELGCDFQISSKGTDNRTLARFIYHDNKTSINCTLLVITRLKDEYYLVNIPAFLYKNSNSRIMRGEWYKCDQLDVLKLLINDNLDQLKRTIRQINMSF